MSATTNKVSTFSGKFLSWIDNNTYELTNNSFNPDEQRGRTSLHNGIRLEYICCFNDYLNEVRD